MCDGESMGNISAVISDSDIELPDELKAAVVRARRTAFVARFIVLRESKRSRSHRIIEQFDWSDTTTAEELHDKIREVFVTNGDNMEPVDRDLRRALAHSKRSLKHFIEEYNTRSTLNFIDALFDYERSNSLLFGDDEAPKLGGWRLPQDLQRARDKAIDESEE